MGDLFWAGRKILSCVPDGSQLLFSALSHRCTPGNVIAFDGLDTVPQTLPIRTVDKRKFCGILTDIFYLRRFVCTQETNFTSLRCFSLVDEVTCQILLEFAPAMKLRAPFSMRFWLFRFLIFCLSPRFFLLYASQKQFLMTH